MYRYLKKIGKQINIDFIGEEGGYLYGGRGGGGDTHTHKLPFVFDRLGIKLKKKNQNIICALNVYFVVHK